MPLLTPFLTPSTIPMTARRSRRLAAAAGALTLSLSACGGSGDTTTPAAAPTSATSTAGSATPRPSADQTMTDAAFVASMLPHHKGGIELGRLAATKGVDADVKRLGAAIMTKQTEELATLQALASRLGTTALMVAPIEERDMRDMARLKAASGAAFDTLWLEVISGHHSAAIQMAGIEVDGGQDSESVTLAKDIVTTQTRELTEFNTIIASMG